MLRPRSSLLHFRHQVDSLFSHKNAIRGLPPAKPLARWICLISKKALLKILAFGWETCGRDVSRQTHASLRKSRPEASLQQFSTATCLEIPISLGFDWRSIAIEFLNDSQEDESRSSRHYGSVELVCYRILETRLQYPDRSTFKCTQRSRRTDCWRGRKKALTDSVDEHLLEQPFTA